jgi:hypothetical protein
MSGGLVNLVNEVGQQSLHGDVYDILKNKVTGCQ